MASPAPSPPRPCLGGNPRHRRGRGGAAPKGESHWSPSQKSPARFTARGFCYHVASGHAARLQELHGRHPESKAIAVNLQHCLEWKEDIRAKLENAKVEINYSTAAISQAQEAGIIRQTGSEWWQVELK